MRGKKIRSAEFVWPENLESIGQSEEADER
jgi:hypothetical protein